MIDCSISKSRRAFGLLRTDLGTISETLAILVRRQHRISLIELAKLLPGRDPMKALFQLQTMDCVMFLAKEPAGVILTPPTRVRNWARYSEGAVILILFRRSNPPPPRQSGTHNIMKRSASSPRLRWRISKPRIAAASSNVTRINLSAGEPTFANWRKNGPRRSTRRTKS